MPRSLVALGIAFVTATGMDSTEASGELGLDAQATASFSEILADWNGDIFWAPGSGFTGTDEWVSIFGDEARSVFGPIPGISCVDGEGVPFKTEVDGSRITFVRDSERSGAHVYEHHFPSGRLSARSGAITKCDKPSLANTHGHACSTNSRINHLRDRDNKNVDWVILCRKNKAKGLAQGDDYWADDNPYFALLGIIGFNKVSGEVVFFDGLDSRYQTNGAMLFSWQYIYPPPGGYGYADDEGRKIAQDTYSYTKQLKCETCHDNKEPWVITPHLKYHGFGYRDSAREDAFGVRSALPLLQLRSDSSPYRVIGTRYTKRADLSSKTFRDPTGSCTYCHTLTTDWTGKVLAYDAVGRVNSTEPYKSFFEKIEGSRTDWAKEKGNTRPWMVPWLGPNLRPGWAVTEISEGNWRRIAACINETSKEDCKYKNVYTSCPEPESGSTRSTRLADPFGPSEMTSETTQVDGLVDSRLGFGHQTTLRWSYLNGLGGVPRRDDVRFNLMAQEVPIPDDGSVPDATDYPGLKETADPYYSDPTEKGDVHYCDLGRERTTTCHFVNPENGKYFINNISFKDHLRNTMPEPTLQPRNYSLKIPTQCNRRYLVRLVPKRFCFDRSGVLSSTADHLHYFDVDC